MPRLALLLLLLIPALAVAAEFKPLTGHYAITAENYLDPAKGEPTDSHLRLVVTGEAAADLYKAMKSKEEIDVCTGHKAKSAGEMRCLHDEEAADYQCNFSINLPKQSIEYGVAC